MTKQNNKMIPLFLIVALLLSVLVGCSGNDTAADDGINIRNMLTSLMVTEADLDLVDKYESVADIKDGTVDADLVGLWVSADESMKYTFLEDGVQNVETELYGSSTGIKYTCLPIGDYKILCEDLTVMSYTDDSEEATEMQELGYTAYSIQNDVLYMVTVESMDEEYTSNAASLIILYKVDENGDFSAAVANNPISMSSFYGEWTSEEGPSCKIDKKGITISDDSVNYGNQPLPISIKGNDKLVIEAGDKTTEYGFNIADIRTYTVEDEKKTLDSETFDLLLTYSGQDEEDKPNLVDIMTDWKTEYGYDSWYYATHLSSPVK